MRDRRHAARRHETRKNGKRMRTSGIDVLAACGHASRRAAINGSHTARGRVWTDHGAQWKTPLAGIIRIGCQGTLSAASRRSPRAGRSTPVSCPPITAQNRRNGQRHAARPLCAMRQRDVSPSDSETAPPYPDATRLNLYLRISTNNGPRFILSYSAGPTEAPHPAARRITAPMTYWRN